MKAAAATAYGPTSQLQLLELPTPEPGPGQVRLRVRACGLNPFDHKLATGALKALYPIRQWPWVPGHDVCGVVEAVGPGARHQAAIGQRVMALAHLKAPKGQPTAGGLAEQVIVPAADLVAAPPGLSDAEVAALPMAVVTAVRGLRREGRLKAGQRVLITGGTGGVGHLAVQVARALGAQVTATARAEHHELLRRLGADEAIDYTTTDLTALGQRFDLVFDTANALSYRRAARLMSTEGSYVATLPNFEIVLRALLGPLLSTRRCPLLAVSRADEHLKFAAALIDTGKVRPIVAGTYPLAQVHEAFAQLETGHPVGKVVVTLRSHQATWVRA